MHAQVQYDSEVAGPRFIVNAVENAGFQASVIDASRCAPAALLSCYAAERGILVSWHGHGFGGHWPVWCSLLIGG